MRFILICLLWAVISLHVIGGAVMFRKLFPRESPWFGFVLPSISFLWLLNFIEHLVGIPSLLWLLPFTALGSLWLVHDPKFDWRGLRLPTGIFLAAFAFTLALRALRPNILVVSSGVYDLPLVVTFTMGEKLPPSFLWFPPYDIGQYYTFIHYSASVLIRLLGVDVGTGFNLSSALLSAWIVFATSAIAWTVSRHKVWITLVAAVLVECAANGSNAYMWLTTPNLDPVVTSDLFIGKDDINDHNPLLGLLRKFNYVYDRRELEIPGFWSWLGTFHATCGGQFFTLFSVWSLVEVLRRKRSNWPWFGLIAAPLLMAVTSTWGIPIVGALLIAAIPACLYYRLYPENLRFVLAALAVLSVLMLPTLTEFLRTQIVYYQGGMTADTHTQVIEFLVYWWPIFIPLFAMMFIWRKISPATKIVVILAPIFFYAVESYTIGVRIDMTGKLWGYIWAVGWSVLFPVVARQRAIGFRVLTALLCLSAFISLCGWIDWTYRTTQWNVDAMTLQGMGTLESDPVKAKIVKTLSLMKKKILLPGMPAWCCADSAAVACFTQNYNYIGASFYVANTFCPGAFGEPDKRDQEESDFYSGKMTDPLRFLREKNISAVVIWPDDVIKDDAVARLKQQLAPLYSYQDFRDGTAPNAGVFLYQPGLDNLPPPKP